MDVPVYSNVHGTGILAQVSCFVVGFVVVVLIPLCRLEAHPLQTTDCRDFGDTISSLVPVFCCCCTRSIAFDFACINGIPCFRVLGIIAAVRLQTALFSLRFSEQVHRVLHYSRMLVHSI